MHIKKLLILANLILLSACGGGGDDPEAPDVGKDWIQVNSELSIEGNEKSGIISIDSNCRWTVEITEGNWFTVYPKEGSRKMAVTVSTEINPSSENERTGKVRITTEGGVRRDVTITQRTATASITMNPSSLEFSHEAGVKRFTITSNSSWTITGGANWLSLNSSSGGRGTTEVIATVEENSTYVDRWTELTIKGNGEPLTLRVTQNRRPVNLNLSRKKIEVSAAGGTEEFVVSSNTDWGISITENWLQVDKGSGSGEEAVKFSWSDNASTSSRSALIIVKSLSQSDTCEVVQTGGTLPTLSAPIVEGSDKYGATLQASFTSIFPVTEYGFCYSTNEHPDITGSKVTITGTTLDGQIRATLEGLLSGTRYYVRAYAVNKVGIAYSEAIHFSTSGGTPQEDDNPTPNL